MKNQKAFRPFLFITGSLILLLQLGCKKNNEDPVPPDNRGKVEVYAHRGARSYAPENTIPGYSTALSIGTHWVDMDIVMSREGEVIVSHDIRLNPDIVRGADGKFITDRKLARSLALQEIKEYDVGRMDTASAYSKFFPAQVGMDGI
ncbi:MAG: glycerophosphodiester phosphodiesterase family protein, partial [Bacteroidota bacterium]